jgi:hypothetical protein
MGTPTQVAGVVAETTVAATTAGFQGWSPEPDRSPYTVRNGGDGTAATVYATLTAYAVGKSVTSGGFTYVVRTAVTAANATAPAANASFVNVDNHRGPAEVLSPTVRTLQFYR